MADKKGLSAFLAKQKKKKPTADQTKPVPGPAQPEATHYLAEEQLKQQDAEIIQSQDQKLQKDNAKDGDSSGSDDGEEQTGMDFDYGKYIDKQEAQRFKKQEAKAQLGMGFEEQPDKDGTSAQADGAKDAKAKTGPKQIRFGGKPTFGNKRNKLGGDFTAKLEDEDDGDVKPTNKDSKGGDNRPEQTANQFVNLSAPSRSSGFDKLGGKSYEENKNSDKPAVKPTFRGKFNARGGGAAEENSGVVTNYGFTVALRGQFDKDKPDTVPPGKDDGGQVIRDARKTRDKGQPFSTAAKQNDGSDDDGFCIVQDKDRKRRAQKQRATNNSDSDSDEDSRPSTRGGFRGAPRGRGFFKSSKRDAPAGKEEGQ